MLRVAMLGDGGEGDSRALCAVCDESWLRQEAASELRPAGGEGTRLGRSGTGDSESCPGAGTAQGCLRNREKAPSRWLGSSRWPVR